MDRDHADWALSQFDKLLLTMLVLVFTMVAMHGEHNHEQALMAFAIDNSKLFAGALLTLITGRLLSRNGDSHGNGNGNGNGNGSAASSKAVEEGVKKA